MRLKTFCTMASAVSSREMDMETMADTWRSSACTSCSAGSVPG